MGNVFKMIWKVLKFIMSILIILIVSVILIQRVSNNKVTLGGYSIFTVITESMLPKYQVGDMLLAHDVDTSKLVVGDDVVYMGSVGTFNGKIVTHQIVEIEENPRRFHTKGINNIVEDPVVEEGQILGKVVTKLTVLSMISKVISNQYGFFFIIFVPIVVLVFGIIMDVVNDKEKSVISHEEKGTKTKSKTKTKSRKK